MSSTLRLFCSSAFTGSVTFNQGPVHIKAPCTTKMAKGRRNGKVNKMLVCTACPKGSDAEQLHPELQVPICGACAANLKDADQNLIENQLQYCTWCGNADDVNLLMCDSCTRSFCYDCIARNFGKSEADFVRGLNVWSCYVCYATLRLKSMQVSESFEYYNIERAYAAVHPPSLEEMRQKTSDLTASLSPDERKFAALFTNSIGNVSIHDSELISQYLTAMDLSVVLRLSKGLRKLFQSDIFVIPGLFKTSYGIENQCRLYDHQVVSLKRMTEIENASSAFGALRGGIFGDEPGLGKTVTTLALVATTAGVMPQKPASFWDRATIDEHWAAKRGQFYSFLGPLLNRLQKCPEMGCFQSPGLRDLRTNIEQYCESISTFEAKVRSVVKTEVARIPDRNKVLDVFRQEMNHVREGLDHKLRSKTTSATPASRRLRFERSLCPSSATLIVVPLALLEHWYEQIARHLQLGYFTDDPDERGVVYLDGLGDIVDVEVPLPQLKVDAMTPMASAQSLSHYLIVVTTFERCAAEVKHRMSQGTQNANAQSVANIPLLQMRFLRMIVDEGHEIGKSDTDVFATRVTKFISQIAAERRWVMSGTPTTGANSKLALGQLYRIFQFLRHPRIAATPNKRVKSSESLQDDAGDSTGTNAAPQVQLEPDDFIGQVAWGKAIVTPCLQQDKSAWDEVTGLLRDVLLRHTKADIHLFDPIRTNINLDPPGGPGSLRGLEQEERSRIIDKCKADYIQQTIAAALAEWRRYHRQSGVAMMNDATRRRSILSRLHVNASHDESGNGQGHGADELLSPVKLEPGEKGSPVRIKSEYGTEEVVNSPAGRGSTNNRLALTKQEQEIFIKGRRPKAIVFSQHHWDLEGVAHHLILSMGSGAVCEHTGVYRSSELSRFRHSKRKYRTCPLCGHANQITTGTCCLNPLLLVEYANVPEPEEGQVTVPLPGGHGRRNPGGHYTGRCLCSPQGCPMPPNYKGSLARGSLWCDGFPNPFFDTTVEGQPPPITLTNRNLAIVSMEHIESYVPGVNFAVGQPVFVRRQDPYVGDETDVASPAPVGDLLGADPDDVLQDNTGRVMMPPTKALLWRGGVLGGHAIVRGWRSCGGKGPHNNWHGSKILSRVPWVVETEEASVLMLKEDGSTGLDLSFATHIFLLDPIKDPALRNQIISRAHRMGATGPVQVQLVQVAVDDD